MRTFVQLDKDQYVVLRRTTQWVYDHFVFPYINVFNMVILFSTVLYLNFKTSKSSGQIEGSSIIKMIENTSFPPHLFMVFITFLIYCSEVFISLQEFNHSRLTESQKSRVPKSTIQQLEHDQNNPDRSNCKPGYVFFYLMFNLIAALTMVLDILFVGLKEWGMEILLVICLVYWVFVWKWRPYNKAVEFHNKALRLNHFIAVVFMAVNVVLHRLSLPVIVYVVLVYVMLIMLLGVTICGYMRIVVEYKFRKRLLDNPNEMDQNPTKNGITLTAEQKKKALLQNNQFQFQNQVKQKMKEQGMRNLLDSDLREDQIEEYKIKMRRELFSDKQRMKDIKKEKYYPPKEDLRILNDLKTGSRRLFEQDDMVRRLDIKKTRF